MLTGQRVTLRELRPRMRRRSLAMLTTEEVARFISPPPTTVEGFERFIAWSAARSARPATTPASRWCPRAWTPRSASSRCASSSPASAPPKWGFALGLRVLGHGRVRGRRPPGARLRVRRRSASHRLEARAAVPERPRQRRAAQDRRRAGGVSCASRSCATASISTRCSTRSSRTIGARPAWNVRARRSRASTKIATRGADVRPPLFLH